MVSEKQFIVFGTPESNAVTQMANCLAHPSAVAGALMADNHLGYAMPIGGVVAYEDAISPTGVGFDIACGNKAVKTNINLGDYAPGGLDVLFPGVINEVWMKDLKAVMREIQKTISFGVGRKNPTPIEHEVLESDFWSEIDKHFGKELYAKARDQLGTVGSGNHYVDLLVDDNGDIWVANHFGSRGLGHTIASGFMAAAAGKDFTERVPEGEEGVVLSTKEGLGQFYIEAMQLAGEYAYAGRDYVIEQVLGILDTFAVEEVHNHHNYAWLENGLWVVRKGATPLTRQPAFIGGSMGDISVIVRGTPNVEDNIAMGDKTTRAVEDIGNLGSAPHGAGRVMSRTQAAGKMRKMWTCNNRECNWMARAFPGNSRQYFTDGGEYVALENCPSCGNNKFSKRRMRDKTTAKIDWDAERKSLTERGIVVLGAGADESPGVYKDLRTVLAAHKNIEILTTLYPLGVVMAGADEFDPYKD